LSNLPTTTRKIHLSLSSTATRNSAAQHNLAQPFLPKEKRTIAHPIEQPATTYASAKCVVHETTPAQPTPALASSLSKKNVPDRSSHRAASDDLRKRRICGPRNYSCPTSTRIQRRTANHNRPSRNVQASNPLARSPKQSDDVSAKKKCVVLYFVERGFDTEKCLWIETV
jgi:hypothetical protein